MSYMKYECDSWNCSFLDLDGSFLHSTNDLDNFGARYTCQENFLSTIGAVSFIYVRDKINNIRFHGRKSIELTLPRAHILNIMLSFC